MSDPDYTRPEVHCQHRNCPTPCGHHRPHTQYGEQRKQICDLGCPTHGAKCVPVKKGNPS